MSRENSKPCAHCGVVFNRDTRNTWAYWQKAKYCGQACAGLANSQRWAEIRPLIEDKFRSYVIKRDDGCWGWSGPKDKDGYGVFFHAKKQYRAPAFALKLDGRPVPKGMFACHHCDNPECVNPEHLYPGTPQQNVDDMISRGRASYGRRAEA